MVVGAKRLINCAMNYTDDVYFTFKKIIFFHLIKPRRVLKLLKLKTVKTRNLKNIQSGRASD